MARTWRRSAQSLSALRLNVGHLNRVGAWVESSGHFHVSAGKLLRFVLIVQLIRGSRRFVLQNIFVLGLDDRALEFLSRLLLGLSLGMRRARKRRRWRECGMAQRTHAHREGRCTNDA